MFSAFVFQPLESQFIYVFFLVLFLSFQDSARKSSNIVFAPWWYQRMIRWHSPFCYIPSGVFATHGFLETEKKTINFSWDENGETANGLPSFMNIQLMWLVKKTLSNWCGEFLYPTDVVKPFEEVDVFFGISSFWNLSLCYLEFDELACLPPSQPSFLDLGILRRQQQLHYKTCHNFAIAQQLPRLYWLVWDGFVLWWQCTSQVQASLRSLVPRHHGCHCTHQLLKERPPIRQLVWPYMLVAVEKTSSAKM